MVRAKLPRSGGRADDDLASFAARPIDSTSTVAFFLRSAATPLNGLRDQIDPLATGDEAWKKPLAM